MTEKENKTIQCLLENQMVIMETLVTLLNRTRPRMTMSNPKFLLERVSVTSKLVKGVQP